MNLLQGPLAADETITITGHLLRELKVNVTSKTLRDSLTGNPDYPGIISIADTLNEFKVSNTMLQVSKEEIHLLNAPFLTRITAQNGSFVVVNEINSNEVSFWNSSKSKKPEKAPLEEFLSQWTGLVLVAEASGNSGETGYNEKRKLEQLNALRIPALGLGIMLLISTFTLCYSAWVSTSVYAIIYGWVKFIGVIVSGILLAGEIDKNNPVLKFVCRPGKKVNCAAILNSPAAKVFSWLSWSELGFFYFASGWLLVYTGGAYPTVLFVLALLNLATLPYIIFSIFYQWRVAKQWCVLCLTVQFLFAAEFIVGLLGKFHQIPFFNAAQTGLLILLAVFSFLLPALFWMATKKSFVTAKAGKYYQKEYFRLKRDPQIFIALLKAQSQISTPPPASITWGNKDAENTITLVCSPYCRPCAMAFPIVSDILKIDERVKITMVFSMLTSDPKRNMLPMRHLLYLYDKTKGHDFEPVLETWWKYAQQNKYEEFAKLYPVQNLALEVLDEKINEMNNWCNAMNINYTPTFYVNGYELPGTYTIEDLRNILCAWNWDWENVQETTYSLPV